MNISNKKVFTCLKLSGAVLVASIMPAFTAGLLVQDEVVAIAGIVVAFIHATIFGLPAYFLLKSNRILTWWSCLLSGFVIGALPASLIFIGSSSLVCLQGIGGAGGLGALGGISGWLALEFINVVEMKNECRK